MALSDAPLKIVSPSTLLGPEVVPVRHVENHFVRRFGPFEPGHDVFRLDRSQNVLDVRPELAPRAHGPEIGALRFLLLCGEIELRALEESAGRVEGEPALDGDPILVLVLRHEIELLSGPASRDDLPRIARGNGLVDDEGAGRALLGGDLVLVGPAAVVSHGIAAEHLFGAFDGRVVHQHHQDLVADIDVFVVVPSVLGRDDAVADEDEVRFDFDGIDDPLRPGDVAEPRGELFLGPFCSIRRRLSSFAVIETSGTF